MDVTDFVQDTEPLDSTCEGSHDIQDILYNMLSEAVVQETSDLFKALGDPTRIKIIHAISQRELCVHDISTLLQMGQSAVSHQLRYLRNLRIVKRRKSGKTVFYELDDTHIEQILSQTVQHIQHD